MVAQYNSIWTITRTEQAAEMWRGGMSAAAIALILSREWRTLVTRNSIVGKAHRCKWGSHKLTPRQRTEKPRPRFRFIAPEQPDPPDDITIEPPPLPFRQYLHVGIAEIAADQCRYPYGDPHTSDFRFCAAPTNSTYCNHHKQLCFMTPQQQRRGGFNGPSFQKVVNHKAR